MIIDDLLQTVLRRRAGGESVEDIRLDLIIPAGKRKGRNPSVVGRLRASGWGVGLRDIGLYAADLADRDRRTGLTSG